MSVISIKARLDKLERENVGDWPLYLRVMPGESESEVLAHHDRRHPGERQPGQEVRFIHIHLVAAIDGRPA